MVNESAQELGIWPHAICLTTLAQMSMFRENSTSHLNRETGDWKKRRQARKNKSEKDSLYVWGLLLEPAEKIWRWKKGKGAVTPGFWKMSSNWHQTVQVTFGFLHCAHHYKIFVKVTAKTVFFCPSLLAGVRFCCPKKQIAPINSGIKIAVSKRWFLN